MWIDNPVYHEDMEYILNDASIPWDALKQTCVLITGANGLIGSTITNALIYANLRRKTGIEIYAAVRDIQKAERMFEKQLSADSGLHFIVGDITAPIQCDADINYIIHCASPTLGKYMVEKPIEVIRAGISGCLNLLDLAQKCSCQGFVFLSSMEVYGVVSEEKKLRECDLGFVDLRNVRNCYQETKRMCEMICLSASKEYRIRTVSVRLAQTFGPGIDYNDNRVFAMMARCAAAGEDIVLQTPGTSRRPYLYTAQAVTAILCAMLKGEVGKTYNAANCSTYCSVYEMGEMVAKELADGKIKVRIAENGDMGSYPESSFWNLDTTELEKLGWSSQGSLSDIYRRMMAVM